MQQLTSAKNVTIADLDESNLFDCFQTLEHSSELSGRLKSVMQLSRTQVPGLEHCATINVSIADFNEYNSVDCSQTLGHSSELSGMLESVMRQSRTRTPGLEYCAIISPAKNVSIAYSEILAAWQQF